MGIASKYMYAFAFTFSFEIIALVRLVYSRPRRLLLAQVRLLFESGFYSRARRLRYMHVCSGKRIHTGGSGFEPHPLAFALRRIQY